jgi:pantoate--beta-alanine ligase
VITARDLPTLRERIGEARAAGHRIGFVPTMGALHEGHLSLVRLARGEAQFVAVSIFVNPLQFGPSEDLARYPRREEEDARLLEEEGADLLYLPDPARFYPEGFSTAVDVAGASEGGEGALRPGHFRGVATVVAKLFQQVQPDVAVFGRKDLQQVAVIRRMVRDLDFPLSLVVGETVREADGLALSSRNAYLSPDERRRAADLSRALRACRARAAHGESDARRLEEDARRQLEAAGLAVDYVEAVESDTARRVRAVAPGVALTAAVRLGKTRLIDNVFLLDPAKPDA